MTDRLFPPSSLRALSRPPWLLVQLPGEHEVLSWAIVNGGRRRARSVAWLEVKNADLPLGVDPRALLAARLAAEGLGGAVGLLTSRRIDRFVEASAGTRDAGAEVVATVGLSNALRVGDPPGVGPAAGTINMLCRVSARLTEEAALEALSILVEARTTAVREAGVPSRRSGDLATGTGTDCAVLAWPTEGEPVPYAGKHTDVGSAIGRAAVQAIASAVAAWRQEQAGAPPAEAYGWRGA